MTPATKSTVPLTLADMIRSAVEAAVAENPKIRYAHAMTLTDVGDRRDIKFLLGMHKSQLRFGTADDAFNAMTGVHNHVIKATFTVYETHVVMGPTLSCRGRSNNLAMIMAFSQRPDPAATAIEIQTTRNRK